MAVRPNAQTIQEQEFVVAFFDLTLEKPHSLSGEPSNLCPVMPFACANVLLVLRVR